MSNEEILQMRKTVIHLLKSEMESSMAKINAELNNSAANHKAMIAQIKSECIRDKERAREEGNRYRKLLVSDLDWYTEMLRQLSVSDDQSGEKESIRRKFQARINKIRQDIFDQKIAFSMQLAKIEDITLERLSNTKKCLLETNARSLEIKLLIQKKYREDVRFYETCEEYSLIRFLNERENQAGVIESAVEPRNQDEQ